MAIALLVLPFTPTPASAAIGRVADRGAIATTSIQSFLGGVSCTARAMCIAVGTHQQHFGNPFDFAERSRSTGWSLLPDPNPAGTIESSMDDVSCITATRCTAVGFIGTGKTLAEQWNGTSWNIQPTPTPAGVTESILQGVSCTSASACVAVGVSYASGFTPPVAERWDGNRWILQSVPSPVGATSAELQRVSCASAGACFAVGDFGDRAGNYFTLAARWDGTRWSLQRTPNPSGEAWSFLDGISCSSSASCTATGLSTDSAGNDKTLAEHWDGVRWTIESTPSHAGTRLNSMIDVSCASSTACVAVGEYGDTGNYFTSAERWNGTRWTSQTTPAPGLVSSLSAVTCTSTTSCTAVGSYSKDLSTWLTLVVRFNGTSWAVAPSPNPSA